MNPIIKTQHLLSDFISLIFPRLCQLCNTQIPNQEDLICITCDKKIPKANQINDLDNNFIQRFYGRVNIVYGAAYYLFGIDGKTKKLMHQLKYKNRPQIGIKTGNRFAKQLLKSPHFPRDIHYIIPVPLHPIKLHRRGYNQSDVIAKGLSEVLKIPIKKNIITRKKFTDSQTAKSRSSRMENVETAFETIDTSTLQNKHILIVDDVLTTGATLEACANTLLKTYPNLKISMLTLAMAES